MARSFSLRLYPERQSGVDARFRQSISNWIGFAEDMLWRSRERILNWRDLLSLLHSFTPGVNKRFLLRAVLRVGNWKISYKKGLWAGKREILGLVKSSYSPEFLSPMRVISSQYFLKWGSLLGVESHRGTRASLPAYWSDRKAILSTSAVPESSYVAYPLLLVDSWCRWSAVAYQLRKINRLISLSLVNSLPYKSASLP